MNKSIRQAFGSLARLACEEFVKNMRVRVIDDRDGKEPYLERYYLFGGPRGDGTWSDSPLNVYLHRFCKGDDSNELHNHPWEMAVSFVLAGGYDEERRMSDDVITAKRVLPFSLNVIEANDFHRVDLLERDAWTLFVVAKKTQSWGFWDRMTKVFTPWREFIAKVRGVDPATLSEEIQRSEDVK